MILGRLFAEWLPPPVEILPNYDGPIFFEFLRDGLQPFVPDMTLLREREIDLSSIPSDIRWHEFQNGRLGTSRSMPDSHYREKDNRILETRFDNSRKSLIDLLAELLAHCVALSGFDAYRYQRENASELGKAAKIAFTEISLEDMGFQADALGLRKGKDDPAEIDKLLSQLCVASGLKTEFDFGNLIGDILALISRTEFELTPGWGGDIETIMCQDSWPYPLPLSPSRFHHEAKPYLSRLMNQSGDRISSSVLATIQYFHDEDRFSSTSDDRALRLLRTLREAVEMMLGQVLAGLQSADAVARERDIKSIYPRSLPKLTSEATSERVGGMLELVHQLWSGTHPMLTGPETILGMLANGVEATIRDVWPDIGRSDRNQSQLSQWLNDKSHRGDELEKRFAHHARHLLSQYRNPATHDLNTIECSWSELQHFIHGLIALREMATKLKGGQKSTTPPRRQIPRS